MNGKDILDFIGSPKAMELFSSLYGKDGVASAQQRYCRLTKELLDEKVFPKKEFPETGGDLRLFSVPGRTELGGNHTDHNHGKVLAASINLDAAAVAAARQDMQVLFRSVGHRDVKLDLTDLSVQEKEKGDTEALIRGIAAEFAAQGTPVRGFTANAESLVFTGSGLSSSAAVEVLFGKIFDNLFCGGKRSALDLAKIAQKAENVYFGKPCGLMDQIACASGGAAAIDFQDLKNPKVKKINFDPAAEGFALCVVNTKGSHSDLTADYAAIPNEMKAIAAFFGKEVLRDLEEETFFSRITDLRKAAGDRAVMRALHFFSENKRVDAMLAVLEELNALPMGTPAKEREAAEDTMNAFLSLIRKSGDSSLELLQNIYSTKNPSSQGIGLALALTKEFLRSESGGDSVCNGGVGTGGYSGACYAHGGAGTGSYLGACRVHGGGFAGTIQAYIPTSRLNEYRDLMDKIFGKGALTILRIRPQGAIEITNNK